jgi:uncharacterized protein YfiM (DUF2279 family)
MQRFLLCVLFLSVAPLLAQDAVPISPDSVVTAVARKRGDDRWLAKDKLDHFATSAFLTGLGFYAIRREMDVTESRAKNSAMVFTFSCGIFKEVYDKVSKKGIASFKDLTADAAGIGFGFALLSLSNHR